MPKEKVILSIESIHNFFLRTPPYYFTEYELAVIAMVRLEKTKRLSISELRDYVNEEFLNCRATHAKLTSVFKFLLEKGLTKRSDAVDQNSKHYELTVTGQTVRKEFQTYFDSHIGDRLVCKSS